MKTILHFQSPYTEQVAFSVEVEHGYPNHEMLVDEIRQAWRVAWLENEHLQEMFSEDENWDGVIEYLIRNRSIWPGLVSNMEWNSTDGIVLDCWQSIYDIGDGDDD